MCEHLNEAASAGKSRLARIHPRVAIVREAQNKLRVAIIDIVIGCDLTEAEKLLVINSVASEVVCSVANRSIRMEGHGNTDKPGGEA